MDSIKYRFPFLSRNGKRYARFFAKHNSFHTSEALSYQSTNYADFG